MTHRNTGVANCYTESVPTFAPSQPRPNLFGEVGTSLSVGFLFSKYHSSYRPNLTTREGKKINYWGRKGKREKDGTLGRICGIRSTAAELSPSQPRPNLGCGLGRICVLRDNSMSVSI